METMRFPAPEAVKEFAVIFPPFRITVPLELVTLIVPLVTPVSTTLIGEFVAWLSRVTLS